MATYKFVSNVVRSMEMPLTTSVRPVDQAIVPERFTSTSSPVGAQLIPPELDSTSSPRQPIQDQANEE